MMLAGDIGGGRNLYRELRDGGWLIIGMDGVML